MIVTEHLCQVNPDMSESQLAKLRSGVINMHVLANVARGLGPEGLRVHLLLGTSEESADSRDKSSVLADAMEPLLGGVYLQHGMGVTQRLVHKLFGALMSEAPSDRPGSGWKTTLRELTMSQHLDLPEYRLELAEGDTFEATVVIAARERGTAKGTTKGEAEEKAAEASVQSSAFPDGDGIH
jgi:ribonuclease-3